MTKRYDVYQTIDRIRPRPTMYLGEYSLSRMEMFLGGCFYMADEYGIECCERPNFGGLHDWVALHYGWDESTAGWCNIIVQECGGDQGKALDRFFDLIEEYRRIAPS